MLNEATLKIITENTPEHFWNTWYYNPKEVRLNWLKRFIKKSLTEEDFFKFMSSRDYHSNLESYEKSEHYEVVKNVLNADFLEKYDYLINHRRKEEIKLIRDLKIWLIERSATQY